MQYKLNPKAIDTLPPGTHGDGNNLYLVVKESGSRAYLLRYQWRGRPQKMGLGSTRDVSLKEARDKAIDANRLLDKGINPRAARDEERYAKDSVLFFEFAEELRLEKQKGFKNNAHKAKWKRTIHVHAKPLHKKRSTWRRPRTCLRYSSPSGSRHQSPRRTCGSTSKRFLPQQRRRTGVARKIRHSGKATSSTCYPRPSARARCAARTSRCHTRSYPLS